MWGYFVRTACGGSPDGVYTTLRHEGAIAIVEIMRPCELCHEAVRLYITRDHAPWLSFMPQADCAHQNGKTLAFALCHDGSQQGVVTG